MSENCKEKVSGSGSWGHLHKSWCKRKATKDGYCTQHHPDTVAARSNASQARFDAEMAEKRKGWKRDELRTTLAEVVLAADPLTLPDAVREAREALAALTSTAIEGM